MRQNPWDSQHYTKSGWVLRRVISVEAARALPSTVGMTSPSAPLGWYSSLSPSLKSQEGHPANPALRNCPPDNVSLGQPYFLQVTEWPGARWGLSNSGPEGQGPQGTRGSWNVDATRKGATPSRSVFKGGLTKKELRKPTFNRYKWWPIRDIANTESEKAGFKFLLFYLLTLWSGESHLTLLSLSFLNYRGKF